jgi:hypothetical protein
MKKDLITALILFCAISFFGADKAKAQNLQLFYDAGRGCATSTVEMFRPDDGGSTFFFIDFDVFFACECLLYLIENTIFLTFHFE